MENKKRDRDRDTQENRKRKKIPAEEARGGVRATNVAMHDRWEGIKRQQMLFIFHQAANGFRIALLVFGLKSDAIEQRVVFLLLFPDPVQFCRHLLIKEAHFSGLASATTSLRNPWARRKQGSVHFEIGEKK
jgi:hypothetical protein